MPTLLQILFPDPMATLGLSLARAAWLAMASEAVANGHPHTDLRATVRAAKRLDWTTCAACADEWIGGAL